MNKELASFLDTLELSITGNEPRIQLPLEKQHKIFLSKHIISLQMKFGMTKGVLIYCRDLSIKQIEWLEMNHPKGTTGFMNDCETRGAEFFFTNLKVLTFAENVLRNMPLIDAWHDAVQKAVIESNKFFDSDGNKKSDLYF